MRNYFLLFPQCLPLERSFVLYLEWSIMFCTKFGWNWTSGSRDYFSYVVGLCAMFNWNCLSGYSLNVDCILTICQWLLFLFGGRCTPFIWISFYHLHQRLTFALFDYGKLGSDSGSWEKAKKCEKFTDKDGQMDHRHQESSLEIQLKWA